MQVPTRTNHTSIHRGLKLYWWVEGGHFADRTLSARMRLGLEPLVGLRVARSAGVVIDSGCEKLGPRLQNRSD